MSLCLGTPPDPSARSPVTHAGAPRFNYVRCDPSPALAPFVDQYWLSRWDRRGVPARDAASLLDPCVHLQVQSGTAEVMGVVRGTFRMRIEDVGCVVGVKFRPGGFYPFVGRDVVAWTDRVAPMSDVFGSAPTTDATWARALSNAAIECDGGATEHASLISTHLDAFLGARMPARDKIAEEISDLVAVIAADAAVRRVSDLVRASARSDRTLHRLFARYVGASPAWVIRRYRLQAAAKRLTARPPADVRTVAWELGYADQAHFIRDFRATIGVTPGAYVQTKLSPGDRAA